MKRISFSDNTFLLVVKSVETATKNAIIKKIGDLMAKQNSQTGWGRAKRTMCNEIVADILGQGLSAHVSREKPAPALRVVPQVIKTVNGFDEVQFLAGLNK